MPRNHDVSRTRVRSTSTQNPNNAKILPAIFVTLFSSYRPAAPPASASTLLFSSQHQHHVIVMVMGHGSWAAVYGLMVCRDSATAMVRSPALASALMAAAAASPCYARTSQIIGCSTAAFVVQTHRRRYINSISSQQWKSTIIHHMHDDDKNSAEDSNTPKKELDLRNLKQQIPNFMDTMLEIPDPRLFAGDLLFLLIINFLLQIASEVSTTEFWLNGGFHQPITMPTTLLGVMVRDSKMSIAWTLSALWNRSYSYSSVSDDKTAIKVALQVWVDYCSLRILLELGASIGFTHSMIDIWSLGMEIWYTAIIMAFFRWAYSRMSFFR